MDNNKSFNERQEEESKGELRSRQEMKSFFVE